MLGIGAGLNGSLHAQSPSAVDKEKFVFLTNGATVGMVITSVLKADTRRLSLTTEQVPKARVVISRAVVRFNDGVKALRKNGFSQSKLRSLAIDVETNKVHEYKPLLSSTQYSLLMLQFKKMYPEGKL